MLQHGASPWCTGGIQGRGATQGTAGGWTRWGGVLRVYTSLEKRCITNWRLVQSDR